MTINEVYQKHRKAMFKHEDFLNIFDGFEMFKHYAVFPVSTNKEMYMITAKKSQNFPADSNQKYRNIISRLGNQLSTMPKEWEQRILDMIFTTYVRMGVIKHTQAEINFYKNDIMLSSNFVDNDVYHLKTKTSGKSYQNKPLRVFKYFYINDEEFIIVNSLMQEIQKRTFTIAYHLKGDKIVVFTTDIGSNKKVVLKDEFDTIDETMKFLSTYLEKTIFQLCWRRDLQTYYSNPNYEYDSFEQSHLDLYFAYLV